MDRLQYLSCVPEVVRTKGSRYIGDHVIRHYRRLGLSALLRDIGADASTTEYEIIGGIGRLVMRSDGSETWDPSIPGSPVVNRPPRPADPVLTEARRVICSECPSMADRCTAAGCGCAGEGKPEVWSSRCPLGKWPTIDCNP